ncbi:hypothetical protein ABKV19_017810 [Rosa sericea]
MLSRFCISGSDLGKKFSRERQRKKKSFKEMEAIVSSVLGKLAEYTVEPVLRQFGYLIHYESNVARLNNQVERLNAQRRDVAEKIEAATRNSETILHEVEIWLDQVDRTLRDKDTCFENERTAKAECCSNGWFPNLKIRHSLSRKAKKMAPDVDGLLDKKFEAVACAARHEGASSSQASNIMNFESRKSTIEGVMEALKGNQVNLIVICGMGGIGKTTMVKEVVIRAKKEGLVDEHAKVVVNDKPDISKIQSDIAESLGLKLEEQVLESRADKLFNRLSAKRVLVVLDNVWETLDLREIGIPSGRNSCKILVTSRNQDIFNDMEENRKKFSIGVLPESDAWSLFKKMAGDDIESDPELRSIAEQVLEKCDGLPVAISTLGSALRRKTKAVWNDALRLLQKPFGGDIQGMKKNVYQSIRLSYDFLEREEAKSCFLLCCIFRESTIICVEDLVTHGLGLGVFHRIDSVEGGRDRVEALVDTLKSCYLLLDSDKEECVRMHDVVRAVGLHIASAESEGTFLIRHGVASENWTRGFICTSLTANKSTHELLLLSCTDDEKRSDVDTLGTLYGVEDLKVLDISVPYKGLYTWITFAIMSRTRLESLPVLMRNIQTLCLRGLELRLETISMIGDLRTLTILRLGGSSIQHVPEEFKNLCNLKLLSLADCSELQEISPGVVSSLTKLEELYLWGSFEDWNDVRIIQLSSELLQLPLLTSLETTLSVDILQNSRHLFAKLKRFRLCILKNKRRVPKFLRSIPLYKLPANPRDNLLRLEDLGADCSLLEVSVLLKTTHFLHLGNETLAHPFNVVDAECGGNLKGLTVTDCDALEYLVDLTRAETTPVVFPVLASLKIYGAQRLKEIFHGLLPVGSLKSLRRLIIHRAEELRHVWKTESQFDRLESLTLTDCQSLQVIVAWQESGHHHEEEAKEINFPNLTQLELAELPSLVGICSKKVCKLNFSKLLDLQLRTLPRFSGQWLNGLAPTSNSNDVDVQHLFDPKPKRKLM